MRVKVNPLSVVIPLAALVSPFFGVRKLWPASREQLKPVWCKLSSKSHVYTHTHTHAAAEASFDHLHRRRPPQQQLPTRAAAAAAAPSSQAIVNSSSQY